MAWAVVFATVAWALIPRTKRGGKLILPLIMILGVLPDKNRDPQLTHVL